MPTETPLSWDGRRVFRKAGDRIPKDVSQLTAQGKRSQGAMASVGAKKDTLKAAHENCG